MLCPRVQRTQFRRHLRNGCKSPLHCLHGIAQHANHGIPLRRIHTLRHCTTPSASTRARTAHSMQSLASALQIVDQFVPGRKTARMLLRHLEQFGGKTRQLAGAELLPHELDANFAQLVRLVEHHGPHRGQQFRHTRFAHAQVSKE